MGSAKKQAKSYRTRTTRSSGRSNLLPSDPLQNTARLNDQLRSLGLYAAPTLGDGNCLFRALSDQYYGSPSKHVEVRSQVCDFIQAHPERYEGFVDVDEFGDTGVRKGKGGGLEAYVAGMRQNATYGGHMELSAFAHLTKRNIKVIQPGLVYVIQSDPQQPKSPRLKSGPGDSPSKHTRSSSSRDVDGDGDAAMASQEEHQEEGNSTIYVAYHDWEHFSSVRSLRGPHTGVPRVHESSPPPVAGSSSSASPPPEENLPPAKARKKERERKEREKREAGRLKAKAKTNSLSAPVSSSDTKSKKKDKSSSSSSQPSTGFKLKIPARPSAASTPPTLAMIAPTPISAGASPLSSLSPSPAPQSDGMSDPAAVPLPASVPPSVATSPPLSHSPSPSPSSRPHHTSSSPEDAAMGSPLSDPSSAHSPPPTSSSAPNSYPAYPYTYAPYGTVQYPSYNYAAFPYAYSTYPAHLTQGANIGATGVYSYPSSMSQPASVAGSSSALTSAIAPTSTSTSNLSYYPSQMYAHEPPSTSSASPSAIAGGGGDAGSTTSYAHAPFFTNPTAVAIDPLSHLTHLTHLIPPPRVQRSPKRSFEESEEGSAESGGESKRSKMEEGAARGRKGYENAETEGSPEADVLPVLHDRGIESADADEGHHSEEEEDVEDMERTQVLSGSPPHTATAAGFPLSEESQESSGEEEADGEEDDDGDYVDDEENDDEEDEDEDLQPNLNHVHSVAASVPPRTRHAAAVAERPMTRRQRKKLGLPKSRAVSVGTSGKAGGKVTIPGGKITRTTRASAAAAGGEWSANGNGRLDVRGFRELKI